MAKQFFLVWNPQGRAPTLKHGSYQAALTEAKRLASICKGQEFHVLGSYATAKVEDPVSVTEHRDVLGDIPF